MLSQGYPYIVTLPSGLAPSCSLVDEQPEPMEETMIHDIHNGNSFQTQVQYSTVHWTCI